ncbi:hypothetical protein BABINDRAFT_10229 [Babjeviella inositovora NRRL Y-12698]|uniref:Uncharacterized protein n=1 Tax=Babjeviella inositovora NRRL Y-12698 TaxID=984486 RepID=A0A1E3QK02_9ASCO|nr:uncharacterized protein BABINDRAFT_10229 [Babjeviella inositovora NRRL Y-12698]ODQ77327.1 hypothetical protein BABINDRAFT_10229 [Babjeviella inositovora NRRL Y-12698]
MSREKFLESSPSKYMDLNFQDQPPADQPLYPNIAYFQPPQQPSQPPQLSTGWTPIIGRTSYQTFPSNFAHDGFGMLPLTPSAPSAGFNRASFEFDINDMPFMNSATPFRDRSFHINDFMFDSPVVHTGLNSAVKGGSWFKENMPPASHQKRSITALDTPPRQSNKAIHKALKSPFGDPDFSTPLKSNLNRVLKAEIESVRTPLANKTTNTLPTGQTTFATPARPIEQSSPSTIIIASAKTDKKTYTLPTSPTPAHPSKYQNYPANARAPVMGTFSGPDLKLKKEDSLANTLRRASVHSKHVDPPQPATLGSRPASMQSGMSKFQIIFTDVKSLLQPKGKGRKGKDSKKKLARANTVSGLRKPDAPPPVAMTGTFQANESKGLARSLSAPTVKGKGVPPQPIITPQKAHHSRHNTSTSTSSVSSVAMSAHSYSAGNSSSVSRRGKSTGITPIMQNSMSFSALHLHETPSLSRSGAPVPHPQFHCTNNSAGNVLYGHISNLSIEYENDIDSPRTKELMTKMNKQKVTRRANTDGPPDQVYIPEGQGVQVQQAKTALHLYSETTLFNVLQFENFLGIQPDTASNGHDLPRLATPVEKVEDEEEHIRKTFLMSSGIKSGEWQDMLPEGM